jgi:hypothetical protein
MATMALAKVLHLHRCQRPFQHPVWQSLFQFFWVEHVSILSAPGMLSQRLAHRLLEKLSWKGKHAGPAE